MVLCLMGCDFQSQTNQIQQPIPNRLPSLVFSDYADGCWYSLELHIGESLRKISHPQITCYERENEDDISPDHKASLLHTLSKGVVEDGTKTRSVETYACRFLDFESGEISYSHTYTICGGKWDEDNYWVVNEEERYSISELF